MAESIKKCISSPVLFISEDLLACFNGRSEEVTKRLVQSVTSRAWILSVIPANVARSLRHNRWSVVCFRHYITNT